MESYNQQYYSPRFGYTKPTPKPTKMKMILSTVVTLVVLGLIGYGITRIPQVSDMINKRKNYAVTTTTTTTVPTMPVAPVAPMAPMNTVVMPVTDARPMSTPTTLASKYGLGGGPLVGSQSTRLGGSEFLPSRTFYYHDNDFLPRAPTKYSMTSPVVAPVTNAAPTSLPPPIASFSEPPSQRTNFQLGAMPTPYQTVDGVYIDTRDGLIIQPR
jgi:hypothetical protein